MFRYNPVISTVGFLLSRCPPAAFFLSPCFSQPLSARVEFGEGGSVLCSLGCNSPGGEPLALQKAAAVLFAIKGKPPAPSDVLALAIAISERQFLSARAMLGALGRN